MTAPIGTLVLSAHNGRLTGVTILGDRDAPDRSRTDAIAVADAGNPVLVQAQAQLERYFAGCLRCFHLPVDLSGMPPFTRKVLEVLQTVPFGATLTYGELAAQAGAPGAARAVGRAMAANPLPIIIPCHRVIAAGGRLCGYSGGGGVKTKAWLLAFEQGNRRLC